MIWPPGATWNLTETLRGQPSPTLFSLLDNCVTSMGSRLLRHTLHHPLREQEILPCAMAPSKVCLTTTAAWPVRCARPCAAFADIERIAGTRRATQCPAAGSGSSLRDIARTACPELRAPLTNATCPTARPSYAHRTGHTGQPRWAILLTRAISRRTRRSLLRDGGVIAAGYDPDLDELRAHERQLRRLPGGHGGP